MLLRGKSVSDETESAENTLCIVEHFHEVWRRFDRNGDRRLSCIFVILSVPESHRVNCLRSSRTIPPVGNFTLP